VKRDVTRAEYRMVVGAQLGIALIGVTLWALGQSALGWWGGSTGIAIGIALAVIWRRRHVEVIRRLERKS